MSPIDMARIRDMITEMVPKEKSSKGNISQFQSDYGRLLNQSKAFEGGGLLPQPGAGKRIPSVTGFKLLSNAPAIGGAKVVVGWNGEQLARNDKVQLQVWASSDYAVLTTTFNPKDVSQLTLTQFAATHVFSTSPGELFIPASQPITVVITAATLHSSGVLSLLDFQSSVAVNVTPLGSVVERKSADFNVSLTTSTTYLIDTTAGNVLATLPPVSTTLSGVIHTFKKISTDVNTMTIGGPENIDSAPTLATPAAYMSYVITADKIGNQWWLIR